MDAAAAASNEIPNPYKKTRVNECRELLVAKDEQLAVKEAVILKKDEDAVKKDEEIARLKQMLNEMSAKNQQLRHDYNTVLSDQREQNWRDFVVFLVLAQCFFKTDANGNSKLTWMGLVFLRVFVPETSPQSFCIREYKIARP